MTGNRDYVIKYCMKTKTTFWKLLEFLNDSQQPVTYQEMGEAVGNPRDLQVHLNVLKCRWYMLQKSQGFKITKMGKMLLQAQQIHEARKAAKRQLREANDLPRVDLDSCIYEEQKEEPANIKCLIREIWAA